MVETHAQETRAASSADTLPKVLKQIEEEVAAGLRDLSWDENWKNGDDYREAS